MLKKTSTADVRKRFEDLKSLQEIEDRLDIEDA